MRCPILGCCLLGAALILHVASGKCLAQVGCAFPPGCATPACGAPGCAKAPCQPPYEAQPPRGAPAPEEEELPPVSPGMYAAPPRAGTTVGATRSLGLNGLKITFPEWSIKFPSIQFPSFTRYRRNSHMELDRATAPWVANPNYGAGLVQREAQLRELRRAREENQGRGAPSCTSRSSCDAGDMSSARDAELRRLQESERILREQVTRLQRSIEEFRLNTSAPVVPTPPAALMQPRRLSPQPDYYSGVQQSSYVSYEPAPLPLSTLTARRLPSANDAPPELPRPLRALPPAEPAHPSNPLYQR